MAKRALERAIEQEDVAEVEALLAADPDEARRPLGRGETYLMRAARASDAGPALVKLLLGAGADVLARDALGATALHWAIDANRPAEAGAEVVELLVRAGADLEATGQYGWTALHFAVERGGAAEVEALLEAGARLPERFPEASPGFCRGKRLLDLARGDPAKLDALRRAGAR